MTLPVERATLAALARAYRVLLAPAAFPDDEGWRRQLSSELRALFGADHALVLRAGAPRPYVGDGFDPTTLAAMAAFHPDGAPSVARAVRAWPGGAARGGDRVRYHDPALERLQARRLADPDPVFTRRGNEAAMGRSVEGTAMFDAVCRPLGIADFCGVFARTPHGDAMLFVARGRRASRGTPVGADAEPLLRVLAPGLGAALALASDRPSRRTAEGAAPDASAAPPPGPAALRSRFGLTPREADVARGLARGQTLKQLAAELGVSTSTARHHTESVFRKLGVRTRGAVALALLGQGEVVEHG